MSLKTTILKNLFSEWISKLVMIASAIFITPILLRHFGIFEYGLWQTIGESTAFLVLFDLGIANSIARFISKNLALNNDLENQKVYSTSLAIFSGAALLSIVVSIIILPYIPDIFDISVDYHYTTKIIFLLMSFNIMISFPLRIGRGLLQAKNRYDTIAYIQLVTNVLYFILILIFFYTGIGDLILLTIITLSTNLLSEIILFILAKNQHNNLKFNYNLITKNNFKELFSLGFSSLVQSFAAMIYTRGMILVVSILVGVSSTPLFAIPNSLLNKIGPFINRLGSTFMPIASTMQSKNETYKLKELNILGVRYGLAISIPLMVFLFFYGKTLLEIWLGTEQLAKSDLILMSKILAIMIIPFGTGSPQIASRTIFRATDKHWFVSNSMLISVVSGLVVSVLLIKITNLGVLAAAIGWTFRFIILDIIIMPIAVSKYLKIRYIKYLSQVYLKPLIAACVLIIYCYLSYYFTISNIYLKMFLIGMIYTFLSLILIYFVILEKEHKDFILKKIYRVKKPLSS